MNNLNKFEETQSGIRHRAAMLDACLMLANDETLPRATQSMLLDQAELYAQECVALVQLAKEYFKESLIEKTQSNEGNN